MNKPAITFLPADQDSQPFWDGLAEGKLLCQRCASCGTFRWPARAICNACYSLDFEWQPVSGRGTVQSWIKTQRAFMASHADKVPYVTVRVSLAEEPNVLIVGDFHAADGQDPAIGMEVVASIQPVSEKHSILAWEPAA